MLTLGWRFSLAENADGAAYLINPINLCEAIAFSARGCCALAAGGATAARLMSLIIRWLEMCCEEAPKVLDYA